MASKDTAESIALVRYPINFLNDIQHQMLILSKDEMIDKYGKEEYDLKVHMSELIYLYDNTVLTYKDLRQVFLFVNKLILLCDTGYEPIKYLPIYKKYPQATKLIDLLRKFHDIIKKYNNYMASDDEVNLKYEQKCLGSVILFAIEHFWIFEDKEIDFTKPIDVLLTELETIVDNSLKSPDVYQEEFTDDDDS